MADDIFLPPQPPRPFIGRRTEIEWLEQEIWSRGFGGGRPIVVSGSPGIGKTALIAEVLWRQRFVSVSVSTQIGQGKPEPARTVSNGAPPHFPVWMASKSVMEHLQEFDTLMRYRNDDRERRDVIVVLDGFDEISEETQKRAVGHILNFKLVRTLIITSRTEVELRGERTLRLDGLPATDAESLITDLSQSNISRESMERMLEVGDGHPLAISILAALAKSLRSEDLRNVLAGHLYDLRDITSDQRGKLISVAKPIIISANAGMIAALKKQPKDIFTLSPRKYEELVAELMRDMGYEVTLTKATRDGGKDILASIKTEVGDVLCLVEAKRYREDRKIGVSLVRALYGTLCDYQATNAMLVTTSSYSKEAHALQKKHQYQLTLRDYADVATWIQRYGTNQKTAKN